VHVLTLIAGLPVLEWFARHRWFMLDDFDFLLRTLPSTSGATAPISALFEPHVDHWSTIPFLVYGALERLFGTGSYWPYVTVPIVLYLVVGALLRVVMRRAGAGPWVSTGIVAVLIFFGGPSDQLLWAAFMGVAASLVCGLVQLLLADHDGAWDRRDSIGLAVGLVGFLCSAFAVTMTVVVGVAVLLRLGWRSGWRRAAGHTVPGAVLYATWYLIEQSHFSTTHQITSIGAVLRFMYDGLTRSVGTFTGLTDLSGLLSLVLLLGLVYVFGVQRRAEIRGALAASVALAVGAVWFFVLAAASRLSWGLDTATTPRYLYVGAVLLAPAAAVALTWLAAKHWSAAVLVAGVLVVALVVNVVELDHIAGSFGRVAIENRRFVEASAGLALVRQLPPSLSGQNVILGLDYAGVHRLARDAGLPTHTTSEAAQITAVGAAETRSGVGAAPTVNGTSTLARRDVVGARVVPDGAGCVTVGPAGRDGATLPVRVRGDVGLTVTSPSGPVYVVWRDRRSGARSYGRAFAGVGAGPNYLTSSAPFDVDLVLRPTWHGRICGLTPLP